LAWKSTESFYRVAEVKAFDLLDEVDDIPVGPTPKAMEVVVAGIDQQTGMCVVVEGAAHHRGGATKVGSQTVAGDDRREGMVAFDRDQIRPPAQACPLAGR